MQKQSFIYIISNKCNTTLYIGVTSDLIKRIYQHKNKQAEGFSAKYNLNKLVYYEVYEDINVAIEREKQLKRWARPKKERLISSTKPS